MDDQRSSRQTKPLIVVPRAPHKVDEQVIDINVFAMSSKFHQRLIRLMFPHFSMKPEARQNASMHLIDRYVPLSAE